MLWPSSMCFALEVHLLQARTYFGKFTEEARVNLPKSRNFSSVTK